MSLIDLDGIVGPTSNVLGVVISDWIFVVLKFKHEVFALSSP